MAELLHSTQVQFSSRWSSKTWRKIIVGFTLISVAFAFIGKTWRGSGLDLVIDYRYSARQVGMFDRPEARIFYDFGQNFRQEDSVRVKLRQGVNRSRMRFPLPDNLANTTVRFDPSDAVPAQMEIYVLGLHDRISGNRLETLKLKRLTTKKDGVYITQAGEFAIIECLIDDPVCLIETGFAVPEAAVRVRGISAAILPSLGVGIFVGGLALALSLWASSLWSLVRAGFKQLANLFRSSQDVKLSWTQVSALVAFCLALVILTWTYRGNYEQFRVVEAPFQPQFAGPATPTSDALAIWVTGALNFHALNEPYRSTYRCLPAIWHASFLNLHFDISRVPMAMFYAWLAVFTCFFLTATPLGKAYFLACLWGVIFSYASNFKYLAPHAFGPGMMAFGTGVIGTYLVALTIFRSQLNRATIIPCIFGFLSLGIGGSARGPLLLAGVSMLILATLVTLSLKKPKLLWLVTIGGVAFLIPGVIDSRLRSQHQINNNGWSALYVTYSDPEHKWNTDTYVNGYLKNLPDDWTEKKAYHRGILKEFFQFRLSPEGWKDLSEKIWGRTYIDGRVFVTTPFQTVGVGFVILALILSLKSRKTQKNLGSMWLCLHGLIPLILDRVEIWNWSAMGWILLSYMVLLCAICLVLRLHLGLVVILAGYACVVFHSCVGMTGSARAAATYNYFLFLVYLLAPLEYCLAQSKLRSKFCWQPPKFEILTIGIYAFFLAVISFGVFVIRTDFEELHRAFYLMDGEQKLVMKLSNDRNLNRSLYLPPKGEGHVFYTTYDHLQPGFFRVVDPDFRPADVGWRTLLDPLPLSPPVLPYRE